MCIDNIITVLNDKLDVYKKIDNIELEGRLGIYDIDSNKFDTDIGEEYFGIIKEMLVSFDGWESVVTTNTTDYFYNKYRMTVDNETAQRVCVEKKKLVKYSFYDEGLPFDFRISISKEDPVKLNSFPTKGYDKMFKREKNRTSYTFQNVRFDLTVVHVEKDDVIEENFEVEIEYIGKFDHEDEYTNKNILFCLLYKILDCIFACNGFVRTRTDVLPLDSLNLKMV